MRLPTQAEINTAGRYAGAIAGTAISIFGLQAKGISLDQVKAVIAACGTVINDISILVGAAAPLYLAIRGIMSSSKTSQAAAIGASPSTTVNAISGGRATVTINDPAMAQAALEAQKTAS
jgi:hypothetical protein